MRIKSHWITKWIAVFALGAALISVVSCATEPEELPAPKRPAAAPKEPAGPPQPLKATVSNIPKVEEEATPAPPVDQVEEPSLISQEEAAPPITPEEEPSAIPIEEAASSAEPGEERVSEVEEGASAEAVGPGLPETETPDAADALPPLAETDMEAPVFPSAIDYEEEYAPETADSGVELSTLPESDMAAELSSQVKAEAATVLETETALSADSVAESPASAESDAALAMISAADLEGNGLVKDDTVAALSEQGEYEQEPGAAIEELEESSVPSIEEQAGLEASILSSEEEASIPIPAELVPAVEFRYEAIPELSHPPIVGLVTSNKSDPLSQLETPERIALRDEFRRAYLQFVLATHELNGVLGGDRVHTWAPSFSVDSAVPETGALTQNWKNFKTDDNSWGLPGLVIAARPPDGDRVFLVEDPILDAYGRGLGLGGANGIAGYGAPISAAFPLGADLAQRFEAGILVVAADGNARFLPEKPVISIIAGVENGADEKVGEYAAGDGDSAKLAAAASIKKAWYHALNSGRFPGIPDNPVFSLERAGLAIQSFDRGAWALVFSPEYGAVIVDKPAIDLVLAEADLEAAFTHYGYPLADPKYRLGEWVQRWSLGLMTGSWPLE